MSDAVASPVVFPVQMGGLNSLAPASMVYPDALTATNVRWGRSGELLKRSGFTPYNTTAMPATTRAITGVAQFNRRDTTTRYTIVGVQDKLFRVPTSGAWTTLVSGLTASATDYWDFTVFNNELIAVNGVDAPQVTDGTAANTGALSARVWKTMTASTSRQGLSAGMRSIDQTGPLYHLGGRLSTGASDVPDSRIQKYDAVGDAWSYATGSLEVHRYGYSASVFGGIVVTGGVKYDSTTVGSTTEFYRPNEDTWSVRTNMTVAKDTLSGAGGWEINNSLYAVGGTTTLNATGGVTTNYQWNPVSDTWTTKTAIATARVAFGDFSIAQLGYLVGGRNTSNVNLTTVEGYDPFADVLTATAEPAIGTSTRNGAGTSGTGDAKGYFSGGDNDGASFTTVQGYSVAGNSWSSENAMGTARASHASATSDYWIYAHGDNSLQAAEGTLERMNSTPSAPTAFYVEVLKGYVILARTSSFPSRLFYSLVGDNRQWPPFNFFDVNPDDGDWITGLFVFDGRLYVTKTDTIYEIPFTVLDPEEGDQRIIPLENVKGCVSNRSIVVTDMGVFYLAEDGFRLFDGARSVLIGEKIQVTLDGYVQSRLKYTAGVWLRAQDEIWWSVTSTGSTHDTILCYNYRHKRWSLYSGIAAESIATVEDANDIDQILFGTGTASDGKLYTGNTTNADNGGAISATYQTGWFSPVSGLNQFTPKGLYGWINRSGNWSLTVATRARYGTANLTSDAVNLLSGTYPDSFFQDATDQRFHIQLGSGGQDLTGHAHSLVLTNANASEPFTLHGLVMTGDHSVAGGTFPV